MKCTLQNFERTVQIVVHQQPRIYEAFPGSGRSIGVKCIAGFEKQVLTFWDSIYQRWGAAAGQMSTFHWPIKSEQTAHWVSVEDFLDTWFSRDMGVWQRFAAFFNLWDFSAPKLASENATCSIWGENIWPSQPWAVPNLVHHRQGRKVVCLVWGNNTQSTVCTSPLAITQSKPFEREVDQFLSVDIFHILNSSPSSLLLGSKGAERDLVIVQCWWSGRGVGSHWLVILGWQRLVIFPLALLRQKEISCAWKRI